MWWQADGFKTFGYNENLQLIGKDAFYYTSNTSNYTIDEWCELICTELEAGHPIPYHDVWEGHAWVLDGVDAEGKFHMNWGFNGKFDGWYEIDALSFHPYDDDEIWDFSQSSNSGNQMVINCFPYEGYVIPGDDPQPSVERGNVNGIGGVDMDDLTALINYLLDDSYTINTANAAACNNETDTTVDMDDLTALINFLLTEQW